MSKEFDVVKFFQGIKYADLGRNIRSPKRSELVEEYLDLYAFVKKDDVFVDFMRRINGVGLAFPTFHAFLYGFSLPEDELIFSLPQYMDSHGFLKIGEYADKSLTQNWRGIGYAYHRKDQSPVIYAIFYSDDRLDIKEYYYPLCIGFQELIEIIVYKNFEDQIKMAYTPENPGDEP